MKSVMWHIKAQKENTVNAPYKTVFISRYLRGRITYIYFYLNVLLYGRVTLSRDKNIKKVVKLRAFSTNICRRKFV